MSSGDESDSSDFEEIRRYFPLAEWEDLCSYDKRSYRNSLGNYRAMLAAGLDAKPPLFMRGPAPAVAAKPARPSRSRSRRNRTSSASGSDDSDEEWKPSSKRPRTRASSRLAGFASSSKPRTVKRAAPTKLSKPCKAPEASAGHGPGKTYPKRAGSRQCQYAEGDLLDDDDFLFCDDCQKEYEGDCPEHGPLVVVEDTAVSDDSVPGRALLTVPKQLAVESSKIKVAGLGVWTREAVPRRTRFGPYGGETVGPGSESGYGWEIRRHGKTSHCVDAVNPDRSNWMRYVNCPRNAGEENLVAFQFRGSLYYRTVRDVPAHTELLVWYGESYGRDLQIDLRGFKEPPANPNSLNGAFPCPAACGLSFCSPLMVTKHQSANRCSVELRRRRECGASTASTASTSTPTPTPTRIDTPDSSTPSPIPTLTSSTPSCDPVAGPNSTPTPQVMPTQPRRDGAHCCSVCGAVFGSSSHLKNHLRVHSGEKPFACATCGKSFAESSHLRRHERTHSGEKPFACATCGKSFAESSHLRRHERTHSGEKPFACATCGKSFAESGHWREHERTHSGEKPFACATCGKSFVQSGHLRLHERTHTGETPYSCATCGKSFAQSGNLRLHERTHSGETPYSCSTCGKSFARISTLRQHDERTHSLTHSRTANL